MAWTSTVITIPCTLKTSRPRKSEKGLPSPPHTSILDQYIFNTRNNMDSHARMLNILKSADEGSKFDKLLAQAPTPL